METRVDEFAHAVGIGIEAIAVLVVAFGSLQAFVDVVRLAFSRAKQLTKRDLYFNYLRWLLGALTFQLAADIVHTAIAPTWTEIGHVGAIAVIRTFLSYFVSKDVREEAGRV